MLRHHLKMLKALVCTTIPTISHALGKYLRRHKPIRSTTTSGHFLASIGQMLRLTRLLGAVGRALQQTANSLAILSEHCRRRELKSEYMQAPTCGLQLWVLPITVKTLQLCLFGMHTTTRSNLFQTLQPLVVGPSLPSNSTREQLVCVELEWIQIGTLEDI